MDKKIATSNEAAIKYFFNYIQMDLFFQIYKLSLFNIGIEKYNIRMSC